MKLYKFITFTALVLMFGPQTGYALIDDDIVGSEDIMDIERQPGPFRIEFDGDSVNRASFENHDLSGQYFTFSQASVRAGMAFCYFPEHREAYAASLGYNTTKMDWNENPYFDQTQFHTATLSLRLYSNRLRDWLWRGQVSATIDTQHMDFNHYLDFDAVLWGRYEYSCNINTHIGFIVQTGMKLDHVYPIFGFDWRFRENWVLNLVYPTNLSLLYEWNKTWSAEIGMRFFDVRHRTGWNQPLPGALVTYTNSGVEFGINYKWDPFIEANLHVGSTLNGGELEIADKNDHHTKHYDLKGSGYAGAEVTISF